MFFIAIIAIILGIGVAILVYKSTKPVDTPMFYVANTEKSGPIAIARSIDVLMEMISEIKPEGQIAIYSSPVGSRIDHGNLICYTTTSEASKTTRKKKS